MSIHQGNACNSCTNLHLEKLVQLYFSIFTLCQSALDRVALMLLDDAPPPNHVGQEFVVHQVRQLKR